MKNWIWWVIGGVISLIGGVFALANPFAATLTADLLAGWTFMMVGIFILVSAFSDEGWGARITAILLGIVVILLGVGLLAYPLAGIMSLTMFVAIMLICAGIFRLMMAFKVEDMGLKWILIISGVLAIILAVMIFSKFQASSQIVLGVFLGVELISNGIALICLGWARKSMEPEAETQG